MWIVRVALNRPYTFIVLALLIFILGPVTILNTPTDIFPNIDIPVISVAWIYTGLNAEDIEARITTPYEKVLTTLVDNIQHIESTSYNGTAVVKIFLQPGASLDTANAQVVASGDENPVQFGSIATEKGNRTAARGCGALWWELLPQLRPGQQHFSTSKFFELI
jgi:multidrug efflux pump subunit AcrB